MIGRLYAASQPSCRWAIVSLYGLHCLSSLAYEVLWLHLLTAEIGRTLSAMGLVMAVFTAGLGLGAAGIARGRQVWQLSPRLGFVAAQALLGLYGAAFPWLLRSLEPLYIALAPATESGLHHGLRLAIGGLLLLPPACLIGAIFPLLSQAVAAPQAAPRQSINHLYWSGLLCAACGALLGPFWLLPTWGFTGASYMLSALNGVGALGGLWVCLPPPHTPQPPSASIPPRPRSLPSGAVSLLSALLGQEKINRLALLSICAEIT